MSEQLLAILKLCLLAALYLFFMRVLWSVWTQVREPKKRVAAPAGKRGPRKVVAPSVLDGKLVICEPEAMVGQTYSLGDELTIGRAAGCQIMLDDTYISQLHTRIFLREGKYMVEDLGSTNGTYLNRRKVSGPMVMQVGDMLQVGSVILELT